MTAQGELCDACREEIAYASGNLVSVTAEHTARPGCRLCGCEKCEAMRAEARAFVQEHDRDPDAPLTEEELASAPVVFTEQAEMLKQLGKMIEDVKAWPDLPPSLVATPSEYAEAVDVLLRIPDTSTLVDDMLEPVDGPDLPKQISELCDSLGEGAPAATEEPKRERRLLGVRIGFELLVSLTSNRRDKVQAVRYLTRRVTCRKCANVYAAPMGKPLPCPECNAYHESFYGENIPTPFDLSTARLHRVFPDWVSDSLILIFEHESFNICAEGSHAEQAEMYIERPPPKPAGDGWEYSSVWHRPDSMGNRCGSCGGPHAFDTSVPSAVWNPVVRAQGLSEYLCASCVLRVFAAAGQSFTAHLYGDGLDGVPVEVRVDAQAARDAEAVSVENNELRIKVRELEAPAPGFLTLAQRNALDHFVRANIDPENDARLADFGRTLDALLAAANEMSLARGRKLRTILDAHNHGEDCDDGGLGGCTCWRRDVEALAVESESEVKP